VPPSEELRFALTRTLPLAALLTTFGVVIGVFGTHGPEPFTLIAMLLAPGVFLVPYVTGQYVGDHRPTFWLFVLFQLAYYHVALRVAGGFVRNLRAAR
jgi:hypothetical protein